MMSTTTTSISIFKKYFYFYFQKYFWIFPSPQRGWAADWRVADFYPHLRTSLAEQHKTSSNQNVTEQSHLNGYLLVGSETCFVIRAVPADFSWSKPKTSILGMPILNTPPLSQGIIKPSISSNPMLLNNMNCRAMSLVPFTMLFEKHSIAGNTYFDVIFSGMMSCFIQLLYLLRG